MPLKVNHATALLLVAFFSPMLSAKERSDAEARQVADRVLQRAIIIDTHADTPQMMLDANYDLADPASPFMVSIPKARTGHLGAEFMSIWVDVDWPKRRSHSPRSRPHRRGGRTDGPALRRP